jgi:hypothetical protein
MNDKILILSSDGDFLQLQKYNNVKQYNPTTKKFVKSIDPTKELKEKIIKGDKGDGIPNILSPSDCFVRELRQTPITKGKLEKLLNENHVDYDDYSKEGFVRNQVLIDLSYIPEDIKKSIIDTYNNTKPAPKSKMLNYFIEKQLKSLTEVIEEF